MRFLRLLDCVVFFLKLINNSTINHKQVNKKTIKINSEHLLIYIASFSVWTTLLLSMHVVKNKMM
jgi:hypothetical protein